MTISNVLFEDLAYVHRGVSNNKNFQEAVVLITGCAGFLGFYFMQYFSRYGAELGIKKIIGLDNFLLGRPKWLSALEKDFPDLLYVKNFDVSNDNFGELPSTKEANYVIHAASIASPSFYRKYPLETIDANIWGLRAILDFYRSSTALRGLLFFSSSEIYGDPDPESIPTTEDYRGRVYCNGPRACYDESKRLGETLCWVYGTQFKMPVTVARPFNNYGPGMAITDKRLPADFARSVMRGEDLQILSNGSPTRTFCYVSDAITGYLLCLLHGTYDYFNIGMDKPELTVRKLAEYFVSAGERVFGYSGQISFAESNDPNYLVDNPARRCPSIEKAKDKLGFSPSIEVEAGVLRYLRFLKDGIKL